MQKDNPYNDPKRIYMLAKMANDNAEARMEVLRAYELGFITFEEYTAECKRLDLVLCVLIAESFPKGHAVQIDLSEMAQDSPNYLYENQKN